MVLPRSPRIIASDESRRARGNHHSRERGHRVSVRVAPACHRRGPRRLFHRRRSNGISARRPSSATTWKAGRSALYWRCTPGSSSRCWRPSRGGRGGRFCGAISAVPPCISCSTSRSTASYSRRTSLPSTASHTGLPTASTAQPFTATATASCRQSSGPPSSRAHHPVIRAA